MSCFYLLLAIGLIWTAAQNCIYIYNWVRLYLDPNTVYMPSMLTLLLYKFCYVFILCITIAAIALLAGWRHHQESYYIKKLFTTIWHAVEFSFISGLSIMASIVFFFIIIKGYLTPPIQEYPLIVTVIAFLSFSLPFCLIAIFLFVLGIYLNYEVLHCYFIKKLNPIL